MIKRAFLAAIIAVFVLLTRASTSIEAQVQIQPTPSPTPNLKNIELDLVKEQYEFLKDEAIRFEDRVDRERTAVYWILGFIAVVGVGSFIGTVIEVNRKAKDLLTNYINTKGKQLENKLEKQAQEMLDQEFGLDKKIVVYASGEREKEAEEVIIPLLNDRGFSNIELAPPTRKSTSIGADIVVFFYSDTLTTQLEKLIDYIKTKNIKIPVLVYYDGRVNSDKFMNYEWRAFANSPLTVGSWVFTILTSFRKD